MEKVDPKLLLGLTFLSNDKEKSNDKEEVENAYSYVIVSNSIENNNLRLAQPGVIDTNVSRDDGKINILFPFPHQEGRWPRGLIKTRLAYLTKMNIANPFSNYKTDTMTTFSKKSVDRLVDTAKEYGAMSFFLSRRAGRSFLNKMDCLTSHFKYHMLFSAKKCDHRNILLTMRDIVQPVITVFDLRLCIPVLNNKRCDGIGLNYELILPKSTKSKGALLHFGCLSMLFSNFRDNLFYLDGVRVRKENPIREETIISFKNSTNIQIGHKEAKIKSKPEKHMVFLDTSSNYIGTTTTGASYYIHGR
jgi:hypothetical protein